ncbi:MAG: hypothetical protein R2796_11835 [Chitinophagaceae bacterium]|nr:hypothetical protein [Chitinophagaceae bacterium]MCB0741836.1 hypothetical protein [Chitinophagaceae bacterium]HQU56356.1 hypothetical protein [Chitinophagaceae bacterium]
MNLNYKHLLDKNFHPDSRVWVYQSNRLFSINEALEIEEKLNAFTKNWLSHGAPVKAAGYLFFGRFIILMADESATGVGGCSTDSSVHFIKSIEKDYSVQLLDRTTLAFVVKDEIQLLPMAQLTYSLQNGYINPDDLFFNNVVGTKNELENNWMIPVKESWISKKINVTQ